jgi:8-oxo-dGTP diphosphatase
MFTYNYPRAALTVDAIIVCIDNGTFKIVLVQRNQEPFKEFWALPGGFINMDETLASACQRELAEETGLDLTELKFYGIYDAIDRDPRGRTISAAYYQIIPFCPLLNPGDDACKAEWFTVDKLPFLAFDHSKIRFIIKMRTF